LFASQPLELLCHDGLRAARFNRFTLGRTLDEVDADGGALLCQALALALCAHARMDRRCNHLDTTSFALPGESVPASEEQAMTIPHGDSREHRPDVQPAVWERLVSQDGGLPVVRTSGDGHTADREMFQARPPA
jgi:hypothetical protein